MPHYFRSLGCSYFCGLFCRRLKNVEKYQAYYINIRSPHEPCVVITQFLTIAQGDEKDKKDHRFSTGQPRICCTLLTSNARRNIAQETQPTLLSMAKSKSFKDATGHFHDDHTWLRPEFISFLLYLNLSISLRFQNNSPNLHKKKKIQTEWFWWL